MFWGGRALQHCLGADYAILQIGGHDWLTAATTFVGITDAAFVFVMQSRSALGISTRCRAEWSNNDLHSATIGHAQQTETQPPT
jgi:hypothetical protein